MSNGLGQISALSYCYIIIIMCSLYLLCSVNFIATASPFVELFTDEASLWLSYNMLGRCNVISYLVSGSCFNGR